MIDIGQLREFVIRPALERINLWSATAEDLVLGTGIVESGYQYLHQIGGPALGFWQMEPATHDDCWTNFISFRPGIEKAMLGMYKAATATIEPEFMIRDLHYAAAMCRIKYYRSPLQLPANGDVSGYARMWKQVYNSAAGAGKEQKFIDQWTKLAV